MKDRARAAVITPEYMHSRRRLIYYTIVATSLIWIIGTLTFMFLDDIEVTVAVKRKVADALTTTLSESDIPISSTKFRDKFQLPNSDKSEIIEVNSKVLANYEHALVKRNPLLPGELGRGVAVGPGEKEKEKLGYERHAFNQLVSDKISIHRSLKDYRNEK